MNRDQRRRALEAALRRATRRNDGLSVVSIRYQLQELRER